MSNHIYADGAIHDDHHKELTIHGNLTEQQLMQIAQGFFADHTEEKEYVEEAELVTEEEKDVVVEGTKGIDISLALSNTIFNPRLFTTEAHYERLHDTILDFIKREDVESKEEYQTNPATQAEWYYILKAIQEAKVLTNGKQTITSFLRQMHAWYPDLFMKKDGEDEERMLRRYASSLSVERKKWIKGTEKKEVEIKDMIAYGSAKPSNQAQTLRVHAIANGLKEKLELLKEEIKKY